MKRRSFLGAFAAVLAAPAIVRADSLMRIVPVHSLILWGDGIHDDAPALQALFDGRGDVLRRDGSTVFERSQSGEVFLAGGTYALGQTLVLRGGGHVMKDLYMTCPKSGPALRFENATPSAAMVVDCFLESSA